MKAGKIFFSFLGMMCLALCIPGCISMTYTPADSKKSFSELGKEDPSEIFYEESRIPGEKKDRVLIGSAEAAGSTSYCTLADIKNKLIARARKTGANAVLITEINHKQVGMVRSDQVKNLASPSWTPVDDSASNIDSQRNMDFYMSGKNPEIPVYEIAVKARFYRIPGKLLAKDPLLLRGNSKPGRKTVPGGDKTKLRIL